MGPGGAGTEGAFPLLSSTESSFLFCHHSSPHCPVQAVIQFPLRVPVTVGFHVVLLLQRLTSGCKGEGAYQSSGKPASLLESVHRTLPLRKPGQCQALPGVSGAAVRLWVFKASVTMGGMNCSVSTCLLQTRSLEQQQQLGTCQKCKFLGPNPDILYQKFEVGGEKSMF